MADELPQEALDADPEGCPEQSQNGQETDIEQNPEPVEGGGV